MDDERLEHIGKKIIKGGQKERDAQRERDHHAREADRLTPRRPVDVAELLPRLLEEFPDLLDHKNDNGDCISNQLENQDDALSFA